MVLLPSRRAMGAAESRRKRHGLFVHCGKESAPPAELRCLQEQEDKIKGTGSCRYCALSNATCSTSVRLQRRPYYRVSEEEYKCCMRLLRHSVLNATLDLKTMKAMLAEIEQGVDIAPAVAVPPSTPRRATNAGYVAPTRQPSLLPLGAGSAAELGTVSSNSKNSLAIIVPLGRERLLPNSPDSSNSSGNNIVNINNNNRTAAGATATTAATAATAESPAASPSATRSRRQRAGVHLLVLLAEQLYTLVDQSYADGGPAAAPAGCAACTASLPYAPCGKSKAMTAYLVVGMIVRTAYPLGLHRDIALSATQDSVPRARAHRLSRPCVDLLDQEIAALPGYPCAIVDDVIGIRTPPACARPWRHLTAAPWP
ncbi:hypothetical protein B0T26DRAFT_800116 [Lasiosphaeria miniovina]|uniref:Uncharacterized protein n=1 Tax=Lasiosphaeria miniovina TaxID=1954250 RepID=A0AA40B5Z4_9PEZI|nr:uncharacterized protein B0T26DRAFT_800116 [Lasiosphaeria miniovina]KAK0728336.1 hypothetical protein B0T26DRAFT_800116 [Lasiosphaeria miniovina]